MTRRDLTAVGLFTALAAGLAWLVALPLWLGDGLASAWFTPLSVAVMATPAIAALIVVRFVQHPPGVAAALGLWPLKPLPRLLGYTVAGVLGAIVIVLAALPIGALLGVYPADFTGFSAYQQLLDQQTGGTALPLPTGALIALQLVTLPVASLINVVPTLGEELGWRGFLLPALLPLGTLPAVAISGVIWGLWHAPLILLGYNYPGAPGWLALGAMVAMCVVIGALLGWLRLRSGSVWPAAFAHAAVNGAGGSYLMFAAAGERVDTTQATILGWSGWILPFLLVTALLVTGTYAPGPRQPLWRRSR